MKHNEQRLCKECGYDGKGEFGPFHGNRCPKCGNYSKISNLLPLRTKRTGGKNKLFKTEG